MNKYLILLLFLIVVVSCNRDPGIEGITNSFEQFMIFLESNNNSQLEIDMPFLTNITIQEQEEVLKPFRSIGKINYNLEITKKSETVYYLKIITKDPESIWSDVFIPYEQNVDGRWVMAPIVKSVQTFDIVPAQK